MSLLISGGAGFILTTSIVDPSTDFEVNALGTHGSLRGSGLSTLGQALVDNPWEEKLILSAQPQVLIIDKIADIPTRHFYLVPPAAHR